MRFLHTADWHIGKKLHGYDLLTEQLDACEQIKAIAKEEQVDAIVIAGDLYDRSIPSVEAIEVFNKVIIELNLEEKFPILAISGNHDSSIRLETGGPWFTHSDFHLHTRLDQAFHPVEINGTQFFLLPYFEPIAARLYFENEEIKTIEQGVQEVVKQMIKLFKPGIPHVLISHFFVAGSEKTESETKLTVGGLDTVPLTLLEAFDYVALGHLHGKDALHGDNARYSGSPLKFSLSEMNQKKGVWIVETDCKETTFHFRELAPLRDVQQIEGAFKELTAQHFYENIDREAYLHIRLTDRSVIPNMMNQLRQIYPRVIGVERVFGREQSTTVRSEKEIALAPTELVTKFFAEVTGEQITSKQKKWVEENLEAIHQEERGK